MDETKLGILDAAIETVLGRSDLASVSVKAVRASLETEAAVSLGLPEALAACPKHTLKARIGAAFDRVYAASVGVPKQETASPDASPRPKLEYDLDLDLDLDREQTAADALFARMLDATNRPRERRASTATASAAISKQKSIKKSRKSAGGKTAPRPNSGFSKLQILSDSLCPLMRAALQEDDDNTHALQPPPPSDPDANQYLMLPRHEVVRLLWVHIKKHNLQDPADKRVILCDSLMEPVFKQKRLNMFTMNKLLGAHLKSSTDVVNAQDIASSSSNPSRHKSSNFVESDDDSESNSNSSVSSAEDDDNNGDSGNVRQVNNNKRKSSCTTTAASTTSKRRTSKSRNSNGKSVFSRPYNLSPQLVDLLGTDAQLARHEVVKQIWVYIKLHDLQDPADKRFILCDLKLAALFGTKRVSMFGMNKILGDHLSLPTGLD
ncbi:hypothetical protein HK100_001993 [Physocladia obscura]|uniref:DM2 domain-containing protein n=1 Tax=Physocladia obscura TaxID=109957 RepID=A0AAD5SZ37_9FUNG|nr:hypothetical protein HK100_001993 [Physocladia obscura]